MQARAFDRICTANAVWVGAVILFVPLIAVYLHGVEIDPSDSARGEVTVGIAVILRATARRFLRSASSNFMRTTFGALGRASARAATRRVVKAATRLVFATVLNREVPDDDAIEDKAANAGSAILAIALGTATLMLSFWGVLHVVPEGVVDKVLRSGAIGVAAASVLAGTPLLAYVLCHALFGRMFAVTISYKTELDGILLQGYFTGAGSFLPMTTDVDYAGSARGKSWVATLSLLTMLLIHVGLTAVGTSIGSDHLEFLGAMFLIYAFIYVFPISPLEGKFIWDWSKWQWLLVGGPILIAFLLLMPVEFSEVL